MTDMGGMCFCDYDGEPVRIQRETKPKARREYTCCECTKSIAKGEVHHCLNSLTDEGWVTDRSHLVCRKICVDYCCGAPGALRWDFPDTYGFSPFEVPHGD